MDASTEILRRIKAGDDTAWEDFYLRFRDRLLCSIRLRMGEGLRRHLESEDVLHSVVREALDDLEDFDPRGPGSLVRHLRVRVLNKIRRKAAHYRAGKRAGGIRLTDSLALRLPAAGRDGPSYLDAERFDRLERALRSLDERPREAVLLRLVEGLSNAEVARVLQIAPDAASKLYNRALARLASIGDGVS